MKTQNAKATAATEVKVKGVSTLKKAQTKPEVQDVQDVQVVAGINVTTLPVVSSDVANILDALSECGNVGDMRTYLAQRLGSHPLSEVPALLGLSNELVRQLFAIGLARHLDATSAGWKSTDFTSKAAMIKDITSRLARGYLTQREEDAANRPIELPKATTKGATNNAARDAITAHISTLLEEQLTQAKHDDYMTKLRALSNAEWLVVLKQANEGKRPVVAQALELVKRDIEAANAKALSALDSLDLL